MALRKDSAASSEEQLSERTGCFDDGDINWGGGEGGGGGGSGGVREAASTVADSDALALARLDAILLSTFRPS